MKTWKTIATALLIAAASFFAGVFVAKHPGGQMVGDLTVVNSSGRALVHVEVFVNTCDYQLSFMADDLEGGATRTFHHGMCEKAELNVRVTFPGGAVVVSGKHVTSGYHHTVEILPTGIRIS